MPLAESTTPSPGDGPAPAGQTPAVRVLHRLRVACISMKTHLREIEKQAGMAGSQLWALSVVAQKPGVGVSDLARAMDIHQSTASNLIRPLLDGGLIVAARSAQDRRAVQLRITPKGTRALRRTPGPYAGALPDALGALDAPTLKRLDRDLGRLVDVLGADPPARRRA